MSTVDLSRQLTDPRKHYAGVRAQQGRVLTDDDFNEGSVLGEEELRRTRLHAIGVYGAPGPGFLPKGFAVGAGGKLDFALSTGELYLGGLRLEMSAEERFLEQKDWLNFDPAAEAPAAPANGTTRTDLVWIEAWQQPVTAIEDRELFEVALGGADTSTRWRTMRRIHAAPGVTQDNCTDAWAAVSAGFTDDGTLSDELELATAATLTVTFTAPSGGGDLCSPPLAGGYLGAENQAIRVQMVDATNFTWGYDNAAPLYRVKVSVKSGKLVRLTFLDRPKDAAHWPLKGQVVELLPWSAALANGQRAAEVAGHLCKVDVSYDPDDLTLEIDVAVPAGFERWKSRTDTADFFDGTSQEDFLYLRVWNRGDDLASPAAIPIASNTLGNTGLEIAFNGGPLRPADHWVIAARPAAPEALTPWRLKLPAGAPPNGVRRYRAPIGLIQWQTSAGTTTGVLVDDCRPPFLPLTRIRNCCSVTVGDGITSYGMFKSVQQAVDSLPPAGGTVCILPGRYEESVRIEDRRNVTLHGCGPRSRIMAPAPEGEDSTAVHILDSTDICVETLALEGGIEAVIRVEESEAVRIADCLVHYRDESDEASVWPAVFVEGRLVEVEGNIVEPSPDDLDRIFHRLAATERGANATSARGGIQLAGGCENIRVAGNVIVGGTGNGITLGSIRRFNTDGSEDDIPDIENDDPCAPCDPVDGGSPSDDDGGVRYESGGDLYEIEIDDNMIVRHGANGISVVRFFGFGGGALSLVTVHGLRISRNRIEECLHRQVAQPSLSMMFFLAYGGISLALVTGLEIESNVIVRNGRDWLSPVCGVFVLVADGLRIEHNFIRGNGERGAEPPDSGQLGIRAGVHVWLAISLGTKSDPGPGGFDDNDNNNLMVSTPKLAIRTGAGQLRVHGNRIEQPLGRALFMLGAGPIHVTDNRFLSEGVAQRVTDPFANTVLIGNFGISREWTLGLFKVLSAMFSGTSDEAEICQMAADARFSLSLSWLDLPSGELAFNDNQVSFLMRDAPLGLDLCSALLFSLDDVSACDNQFEYHPEFRVALADLIAVGQTVRTSDNRLAETWGRALYSIMSAGFLASAADNQSTHCLRVFGVRHTETHNLVMAEAFCEGACQRRGDDNEDDGVVTVAAGLDNAFSTTISPNS